MDYLSRYFTAKNHCMRTIFFMFVFVFSASILFAQKSPKTPEKGTPGKLAKPDVSVLDESAKTSNKVKKEKASDTMNIIPPAMYSRFSVGGNFGIALGATDIPADAISPGFGAYGKVSLNHIMGLRVQYLQGKISGANTRSNAKENVYFNSDVNNLSLQAIFNLGTIDYRQSFPRNNFYFGVGLSRLSYSSSKDTFNAITNQRDNVSKLSNTSLSVPLIFGFKRKVTKNIDIGAEFDYFIGSNDDIDISNIASTLPDGNGYFMVNVSYNITTKNKPNHMDWSNPIDKIYRDLQDAKDQAEAMKADTDKDGIPDYLDQEPNTPEGYKVDNKGVTLDSDGDGIPDSIDPDPYGFSKSLGLYFPDGNEGNDGTGNIYRLNDSIPKTDFVTISKSGFGLPTIVFPPNHFTVHVEQYSLLQQIARILMVDTSASLVIIGHSDNNKPNLTQLTLAERRALEVKRRLYKVYEIEEHRMLVFSHKDPYVTKYKMSTEGLDRKVEFRIIRPVQKRQPRVDKEELPK